jgi:hypothetical protein
MMLKFSHTIAMAGLFGSVLWNTTGCSPCTALCDDMAKFAEDSCGYTITADMVSECKEQQGEKTREERQDCRQVRPVLEEEWDCDELEIYFSDNGTTQSNDTESN